MSEKSYSDGTLLAEEQRVTWLGRILRATSLDEIPELLNVFKGERFLQPWVAYGGNFGLIRDPEYQTDHHRGHSDHAK